MTIILFLVDTSASMNQRTFIGPSFLDLAKGAVDTFLKYRARDPSARGADRYMLLTFEDQPRNIKAGWRENQMVFMQELKNLKATGSTTVGNALGNALHLLNVNRLQSGIDNFGAGRFPHWLEPAAIIVITDGGCMAYPNGIVKQAVEIPPFQLPGSELVSEPFRWDQRIFALVLRLAGIPPKSGNIGGLVAQDSSPIDAICEATGGRSYSITTQKMINQCLESLVQKIQSGVVVTFEKYGPEPPLPLIQSDERSKTVPLENGFVHQNSKLGTNNNHVNSTGGTDINITTTETGSSSHPSSPSPPPQEPPWAKTRRMIYVSRGIGSRGYNPSHWTIPEAFWPDPSMSVLPPRPAHPVIRFKCDPQEPVVPPDLPFDKYELEPSPLTQYILERKQPNVCWYCYVVNSNGKTGDLGYPFGYLKASTSLTTVTLTVLPYNFPVLVPLMEEIKLSKGKPSQQWRMKFDKYLKGAPPYYILALKGAFQKINSMHLLGDIPEKHLSVNVQAHLGKVKLRAREEMERLNQSVGQPAPTHEGVRVIPRAPSSSVIMPRKWEFGIHQPKMDNGEYAGLRIHLASAGSALSKINHQPQMSFRNPFDIQREQLLVQIAKMRVNLKQSLLNGSAPQLVGAKPGLKYRLQEIEELHQLPIGAMGNYQDYLRAMTPPLREIDATPARLHAFGNPFKVDKKMLVDEADIDNLVGTASTAATNSSGQGTAGGRTHQKKMAIGGGGGSETAVSVRHHFPAPQGSQPRKRKPGPLPRDYRFRSKRSRGTSGSTDVDDQSSISGPASPALSEISTTYDTTAEISDVESVTSGGRSTPEPPGMDDVDGRLSGSLMIDEDNMDGTRSTEAVQDDQIPSSSSNVQEVNASIKSNKLPSSIQRSASNGSELSSRARKRPPKIKMTADDWLKTKVEISALIRKPSQDYRSLFDRLDKLPKPMDYGFYEWALNEAERFKRSELCEKLRKMISDRKPPIIQRPQKAKARR